MRDKGFFSRYFYTRAPKAPAWQQTSSRESLTCFCLSASFFFIFIWKVLEKGHMSIVIDAFHESSNTPTVGFRNSCVLI